MKKLIPLLIAILVLGAGAWFVTQNGDDEPKDSANRTSHDTTDTTSEESSDATSEMVAASAVSIENTSFSPRNITVKKGTTVTWTNNDGTEHTVTSDGEGPMSSDELRDGDTYSVAFNQAGTFDYHCDFHFGMNGSVTVTE